MSGYETSYLIFNFLKPVETVEIGTFISTSYSLGFIIFIRNLEDTLNSLTPQQTVRSSYKYLLLLFLVLADGQNPLHTLKVDIDLNFDAQNFG